MLENFFPKKFHLLLPVVHLIHKQIDIKFKRSYGKISLMPMLLLNQFPNSHICIDWLSKNSNFIKLFLLKVGEVVW